MIRIHGFLDYTYEIDVEKSDVAFDKRCGEDAVRRFELTAQALALPLDRRDVEVAVAAAVSAKGDRVGVVVRLHPTFDRDDAEKSKGIALILLMLQKRVLLELVGNVEHDTTAFGSISFAFGVQTPAPEQLH